MAWRLNLSYQPTRSRAAEALRRLTTATSETLGATEHATLQWQQEATDLLDQWAEAASDQTV